MGEETHEEGAAGKAGAKKGTPPAAAASGEAPLNGPPAATAEDLQQLERRFALLEDAVEVLGDRLDSTFKLIESADAKASDVPDESDAVNPDLIVVDGYGLTALLRWHGARIDTLVTAIERAIGVAVRDAMPPAPDVAAPAHAGTFSVVGAETASGL